MVQKESELPSLKIIKMREIALAKTKLTKQVWSTAAYIFNNSNHFLDFSNFCHFSSACRQYFWRSFIGWITQFSLWRRSVKEICFIGEKQMHFFEIQSQFFHCVKINKQHQVYWIISVVCLYTQRSTCLSRWTYPSIHPSIYLCTCLLYCTSPWVTVDLHVPR